jgi:hypothetical protein
VILASSVVRLRCSLVTAFALAPLAFSSPAHAQQDSPPGPFIVDARVALPSFSSDEAIATPLGFRSDQLPERGLGFEIGAHFYPLRRRKITLGLGASILQATGSHAPGEDALPTDPTVESRISMLTPQLSLNFGTSRGWSYISGGYGWTRRSTGDQATTIEEGARLLTLSYGGGARWFVASHFAFNFDLRFYRLPFQDGDGVVPEQPGYTMFIGSAGVSFR